MPSRIVMQERAANSRLALSHLHCGSSTVCGRVHGWICAQVDPTSIATTGRPGLADTNDKQAYCGLFAYLDALWAHPIYRA